MLARRAAAAQRLAQYAYCALFWAFTSQTRPDWAVNMCMALSVGFALFLFLYLKNKNSKIYAE